MSSNDQTAGAGGRLRTGTPPARIPVPSAHPPRRHFGSWARAGCGRAAAATTWALLGSVLVAFALLVAGPLTGAYRVSVVLSDSMRPRWEAGDVLVSTPERPDQVRVGQVISFNPPIDGRPSVTHRVVEVADPGPAPAIRTKGDANAAPDEWGATRLTHGPVWRVRAAIPNLGLVLGFLRGRTLGTATTLVAPMLLLVMLLWRIWRPAPARTRVEA